VEKFWHGSRSLLWFSSFRFLPAFSAFPCGSAKTVLVPFPPLCFSYCVRGVPSYATFVNFLITLCADPSLCETVYAPRSYLFSALLPVFFFPETPIPIRRSTVKTFLHFIFYMRVWGSRSNPFLFLLCVRSQGHCQLSFSQHDVAPPPLLFNFRTAVFIVTPAELKMPVISVVPPPVQSWFFSPH